MAGFEWNADGPGGELHFQFRSLVVNWREHWYRARVERPQVMRAFYEGFRAFVESERYEPARYETLVQLGLDSPRLRELRSPLVERYLAH